MIISRKRFNEAIRDAEERVYRQLAEERCQREHNERDDRRFAEVQRRIRRLEKEVFDEDIGFGGETYFAVPRC